MILIVGLGNPGEKYKNTRHNLGFMVVDKLIAKLETQNSKLQLKTKNFSFAEVYSLGDLLIAKPLTFMNASGYAVKSLITNYSITNYSNVWVIHDDLDLPLGKIKIRLGGGSAGHRGVESIINQLGTDKFVRFRLGIGHPKKMSNVKTQMSKLTEKYVLEEFAVNERTKVRQMIKKTVKAIEVALKDGVERAMNEFN